MQDKQLSKAHFTSVKVIAFDLFDTLVYISCPTHPYKELFNTLSLTIEQRKEIRHLLLTTDTKDVLSAFPVEAHPHLTPLIKNFYKKNQQEVNSTILFEDSLAALEYLQDRYTLYLISNLATQYKDVVRHLNLEKYFKDILFSCDLGVAKPNKEIFDLLKYPREEILMVGNSYRSDYLGALMAGLKAVLLERNTNVSEDRDSVLSINSLAELENLLT